MGTTVQQSLIQARQALSQISETPLLDAQVLLSHCLGKPRSWVMAHPEVIVSDQQSVNFSQSLARVEHGEPLPYVISHWEFYGLDFNLTPDVLIPRPETELLVECALRWLQHHPGVKQVVDLGTGSGCIGITLAKHNPDVQVLLTDISRPALLVARINGQKHGLSERLEFLQADLLQGITTAYDLLCANLPYIPRDALHNLPVAENEPLLALDGGPRGLKLIAKLLDQARDHLVLGGVILLEIDPSHGSEVERLAKAFYPASEVRISKDLTGNDRCVEIMTSDLIFHLCPHEEWLQAQSMEAYTDKSLLQEGFIHCSRADQLLQVANRYYRQTPALTVLWIDPHKLTSEVRWETAAVSTFPHVYGPIDLSAVIAISHLYPDSQGFYCQVPYPNN